MAKMDEEEAIEESRTVTTLENTDSVMERGDTAKKIIFLMTSKVDQKNNIREFLSNEKNSVSKSSEANRSSFKLSFFPMAPELVSVSLRAITTTGTAVAVFAVFGLYTKVLMSSNDFGADPEAVRASFHSAGELVSAWVTVAVGFMARAFSFSVSSETEDIVCCERKKRAEAEEFECDSTHHGLLTLIDTIR